VRDQVPLQHGDPLVVAVVQGQVVGDPQLGAQVSEPLDQVPGAAGRVGQLLGQRRQVELGGGVDDVGEELAPLADEEAPLADGSYTLTIWGDQIHDEVGRKLDGDGDGSGGGDHVDSFFRMFGDADGDGNVDGHDRDLFRSAFGTIATDIGYLWYFDFDGDGDVDGLDNGQFNRRFGQY